MYSGHWKHRKPPDDIIESQLMLCIMPKPCIFANQCKSAHSESELNEWRQRLLLDIENPVFHEKEAPNVAHFREEITNKLNQSEQGEKPVLAEIIGGHTILCDENLFIMHVDRNKELAWMFTVTSSYNDDAGGKLDSIYFMTDNPEFTMEYIFYTETDFEKLPEKCQLWQNERKHEKLSETRILIRFCAKKYGNFCQELIFDFGTYPKVVRKIGVQVATEETLNQMMKFNPEKFENNELSWMESYKIIGFNEEEKPGIDVIVYRLPGNIENLVAFDAFKHLDIHLNRQNYKARLHTLLHIEEYQRRANIQSMAFHLDELAICLEKPKKKSYVNYTANIVFEEFMLEDLTKLVGRTGKALIRLNSYEKDGVIVATPSVYEVIIQSIKDSTLILELNKNLSSLILTSSIPVDVDICFCLVDVFQTLHKAVDRINVDLIFPSFKTTSMLPNLPELPTNSSLSKEQLDAVKVILDNSHKLPVLLLGPFGAGKTRTIAEVVRTLVEDTTQDNRVLICTHSNSAADHYIEEFFHPLHKQTENVNLSTLPLRINWEHRFMSAVSDKVLAYCLQDKDTGLFALPKKEDLDQYSLIISTLVTSEVLNNLDLPKGYFTHIFIDEAAQAMEVEAIVPISLACEDTKIVLAGDHMQMSEPLTSTVAKDLGLGKSLLERLFELYPFDASCKLKLLENFRSYKDIVELSSHLFYEDALVSNKIRPENMAFPVEFHGVEGREALSKENPSYENVAEATEVMLSIAEILKFWKSRDVQYNLNSICVVSYYPAQVKRIRKVLRKNEMNAVRVESVNNIQGLEFDTLIISTVRTFCESTFYDDVSGKDTGFFSNPKLLNTAITRARYQVLIIGDPLALCTIGECRACWKTVLRKCNDCNTFKFIKTFTELMDIVSEISNSSTSKAFVKKSKKNTSSNGAHRLPNSPQSSKSNIEPPPPYSAVNQSNEQPYRFTCPLQVPMHCAPIYQGFFNYDQMPQRPLLSYPHGPRTYYFLPNQQQYFIHRPRFLHRPAMHPFPRVFWPRGQFGPVFPRAHLSNTHMVRPPGFVQPQPNVTDRSAEADVCRPTIEMIPKQTTTPEKANETLSSSSSYASACSRPAKNLSRLPPAASTKGKLIQKMNFVQDYCQLLTTMMTKANPDEKDLIISKIKGAFAELEFCSDTNRLIIERVESLAEETYLSAENHYINYIKPFVTKYTPSLHTKKSFGKVRKRVSELKVFVDNELYNFTELNMYEDNIELKHQLIVIAYFIDLLQHEVDVCEELMKSSEKGVLVPTKVEFIEQQLLIADSNKEQIEESINIATVEHVIEEETYESIVSNQTNTCFEDGGCFSLMSNTSSVPACEIGALENQLAGITIEDEDPDLIKWFQERRNDPYVQEYVTKHERQTADRLPSPKPVCDDIIQSIVLNYANNLTTNDKPAAKKVYSKYEEEFPRVNSDGVTDYSMKKKYEPFKDELDLRAMKDVYEGIIKYVKCPELQDVHGTVFVKNSIQVHINGLKRNNRALPGDTVLIKAHRCLSSRYDVSGVVLKVLKRYNTVYSCENINNELVRPIDQYGPAILLVRGVGSERVLNKSHIYDVKIIDWPLDIMFALGEIIKITDKPKEDAKC